MIAEVVAALALGGLLLWLAVGALGTVPTGDLPFEAEPVEDTPRGRALLALRELDLDRDTGKLSPEDYARIRTKLEREAVDAMTRDPETA